MNTWEKPNFEIIEIEDTAIVDFFLPNMLS
jgi:hypothetical protein